MVADRQSQEAGLNCPSACRGIYREAEAILYKEIDYISEGRNADRFRRNFQGDPHIQVPRVHWQLTSPKAITLDYLPGTKITSVVALQSLGIDTAAVARRATEAYLVQILKHGFLHSDPHPGNIAVSPEGGLIFYDFGMMSSIVPATKERLLDVFYGIYKKDAAQVQFSLQQGVDLHVHCMAAHGGTCCPHASMDCTSLHRNCNSSQHAQLVWPVPNEISQQCVLLVLM